MSTATVVLTLAVVSAIPPMNPEHLWQSWLDQRFVTAPAACLEPTEVVSEIDRLRTTHGAALRVEEVGRSFQQRPIHMLSLGHGDRAVLLWSRMHGDEPSATPALLDVASFLLDHAGEPGPAAILGEFTLLMIPMLNPDGAEIYERRNLQGIDINRDALNLATPEGRILKKIRDAHEPILAFNLHDQDRRATVGDTGVRATIALLAVAGDEQGIVTSGRLRAARACAAIVDALTPIIPDAISRFDEDWNPRAFGDNITAWGTPVVLIESGAAPPGGDLTELTGLNFTAILTVLRELARDDLERFDPDEYWTLPKNRRRVWADVVVRGGRRWQTGSTATYRADLAFDVDVDERELAGCGIRGSRRSRITEVGDARFYNAGQTVDAAGGLILRPFETGVIGWSARRWLTSEVLEDLAIMGVGTVYWSVPAGKIQAAESLASKLNGENQARLEVAPIEMNMPPIILDGPPATPDSHAIADILRNLIGCRDGEKTMNNDALSFFYVTPHLPGDEPALRPGQPASFVLLSPVPDGQIDPSRTRLSMVFINGAEILGGGR